MTDDERTFEALPPTRGRGFAGTWWGRAWLRALEDTALDAEQLRQGRRQARRGAVGAVTVRPGRITALVRDRDGTAHRSDVLVQRLSEADWGLLLGVIANEAGHLAALLDQDMPPRLVEDAAAAGVELLPGVGELEPECACEAWDHCPHTAALSYQLGRLLDEDPLVLLLLRGRSERALLAELQTRAAVPEDTAPTEQGVLAEEAFALGGVLPPLPSLPSHAPAERAHRPTRFPRGPVPAEDGVSPPPEVGVDGAALGFLAEAAAVRAEQALGEALTLAHEIRAPSVPLTAAEDAVRLAALEPEGDIAARLANGSGRTRTELDRAVRAWRYGGRHALAVLEDGWQPSAEDLARARAQVATAWTESEGRPALREDGTRWTVVGSGLQLRYGPHDSWWPYRKEGGSWWPAGRAETDPATALSLLGDVT